MYVYTLVYVICKLLTWIWAITHMQYKIHICMYIDTIYRCTHHPLSFAWFVINVICVSLILISWTRTTQIINQYKTTTHILLIVWTSVNSLVRLYFVGQFSTYLVPWYNFVIFFKYLIKTLNFLISIFFEREKIIV